MKKNTEDTFDSLIGKKTKPNTFLDVLDLSEDDKTVIEDSMESEWKKHWKGMPEFEQNENPSYKTLYVHFRNEEDYKEFAKLIEQNISEKTKSIWYPKLDKVKNSLMRWIEEE